MQKTHSKKLAIIIAAILTLSTVSALVPLGFSTITSRPSVYVDNATADPQTVVAGTYVNITTAGMTITGAQAWLWLSTYGGSEISTALGDRWYAGPFLMSEVDDTVATHVYTFTPPAPFSTEGRTYSYIVGNGWINGTIPLIVQGSDVDYWVKIADISPRDTIVGSEVGVSNNRVRFTAGFFATPLAGAPDTEVTVSGYAIPDGNLYNVTQAGQLALGLVPSTANDEAGWAWTGFSGTFNILDLEMQTLVGGPIQSGTFNILIIQNDTATTVATFAFVQTYREAYLESPTFRAHLEDYSGSLTLNTGDDYLLELEWFPAFGSASVYLNDTLVASSIALNGTGGVTNTSITIPSLITGDYLFRVTDNFGVHYNFTVHVVMVPYITVLPNTGYVGDAFTVTGVNFLDYVGTYVTLYFENNEASPYYVLLLNFTVSGSTWTTPALTVPQSWGGTRLVEARITDGTTLIDSATYVVLARLNVIPDVVNNTVCQVVQVVGTGFYIGEGIEDWFFYVDNSMYFGDEEDWGSGINATGYILTEFAAAGFRPGLHVVHVIGDSEGAADWTIFAKDNFWVSTVGDPIVAYLDSLNATLLTISDGIATLQTDVGLLNVTLIEINAQIVALNGTIATVATDVGTIQTDLTALGATITSIQGNVATILTDVGTVKTSVSSLSSKITSIQGDMATVKTSIGSVTTAVSNLDATIVALAGDVATIDTAIGTVQTSISSLDTAITAIDGDIVTIQTSLGTIEGKITAIEGTLATIETDIGTVQVDLASAQADVTSVKSTVDDTLPVTVDMLPVWIAVVLALIAAIGSIAGVFIIQRKIAG